MALSESKFYMWRTIVSMSHADGAFHYTEHDFLMNLFKNLDLSDEQMESIKDDVENPKEPKRMFAMVSEPSDRAQLFYYARMLMWADGKFCNTEEELYNKLKVLALDKVDFKEVMTKVNQVRLDFEANQEIQKENRPIHRKIIDAIIFWEDLP
jgi:hypothetical protein